jgi:4-coumarate--CoA ligase
VVDRIKEAFKYKNYAIFPSEIENVLLSIEGIEFACVFPVFSDQLGTDLATAVVKKSSQASRLTEDYIVNYISAELPLLKQLHGGVYFMNEMPLTPSGKVHKRTVKELLVTKRL